MSATSDAPAVTARATRNLLLRAMPDAEYARLAPHLAPVTLEAMQPLVEPSTPIVHAHFPESAIISVLTRLDDGTLVENGTVGCEGMGELPVALGVDWTPSLITGQVPGTAQRIEVAVLRELLPTLPGLGVLLQRYVLYFTAQVAQSLACNSVHALEHRCARWLLMTHDRVPGDDFLLTHDVLAQMLAVRRAGVSVAADAFRRRGLIQYRRGRITVLDRPGLEQAACECYGRVRASRDRLVGALAE